MMFRKFSYLLAVIFLFSLIESAFANPIEIHWWHAIRGARGEVVQKIVDDFNKSQSDYKVIATYKGEYDEVLNAAIAAVRAGKQPHIIQVFEVGTQTMMMSGMIYPVYKLMDDYGYKIDWSRYLQPVLSYYVNEDNKLMSMPFNSSTPVMYYNVDMFKKAGIGRLSKENPITWDELGEITEKIAKLGVKGGLVTAWQSWTQVENYSAIHDLPFATKANGYEGLDVQLTINNDKVVNHIARLKKWMDDGNRFYYGGQKYQGPKSEFIAQNAGIYIDSISAIAKLKHGVKDFEWDVAPLPVESWMTNPQNSIIGGASLWVFKGKNKKEYKGVAAFLNYLADTDVQILWHKETGYFPITLDAYEKLKSEGYYKEFPYQEVGIKQLTRRNPTKNSRGIRLGYFVQIRNIINEELELVWNGKKTAKEALDSAVERSNIKLSEFAKTYK